MPACTVPGPICTTHSWFDIDIDHGTMVRSPSPLTTPVGAAQAAPRPVLAAIGDDARALAAVSYGEGSTKDVFEEMAAIANVLVRQQKARGYASIGAFIKADKTYAFAAHDGNQRYARLMKATVEEIDADTGMRDAVRGAANALAESPTDYSNGGYFWDGADIKTNYDKHPKVRAGIKFTDPAHNIYGIAEKQVPGEAWWLDKDGNKTKSRGTWTHKYESTAAWGGTIFWKYNADFISATANKEYD
jgi:hypothetical protein